MRIRRRLTFQLTPLLDLLLIVIFAQYMEVQQAAQSGQSRIRNQMTQMEKEFRERRQELESAHVLTMKALEAGRKRHSVLFRSMIEQHQQVGRTLADTFDLPTRMMDEVLRLDIAGQPEDAGRMNQAVNHLRKILNSRSSELFRFVVRYDEMRKHVSVWELHLLDNGQGLFTDGKLSQRISFESPTDFATQCFEASKAFEEPRPLTLILMTYADTQAGFRRSATNGLPIAVQKLRDGAGGTRWYDYSLMGFRPGGPLIYLKDTGDTASESSHEP
ncbi:MAG: hypothetical protein MK102_05535 [Fuerstiella sp.]|nr:hypothetical protein [Fuerstiella sp.]